MSDWQQSLAAGVAGLVGELAKGGGGAAPRDEPRGDVFGPPAHDPEALLFDPYAWHGGNQEFLPTPSSLDWGMLRRMSRSVVPAAILKRRSEDVAEYFRPEENPYLPGFSMRMRNRAAKPSRADQRMREELTRFVMQCGTITDHRQRHTRDSLPAFAKKVTRDSLVYDQLNAEIVPSKLTALAGGGYKPAAFFAAPAHTIRIANVSRDGHGLPDDDFRTPRYVQVYEDVVVNEWTASEMIFGVRNPRTDLEVSGYGYSELEMLVRVLTAWLNGFDYNLRFFSQGAAIPGILNLKGEQANEKIMRAFKRELQMLISGVSNAHRLPVTQAEGMEFIKLHETNSDMEYGQWMDLLVKLLCALYSMDPAEIGFVFGNTGQSSAMGNADSSDKIASSRDRGLKPLVQFIIDLLNEYVIWPLNPDFEMAPQGLRSTSEEHDLELDAKRANTYMHVNEIRARRDLPDDPAGDCILNPTWLQWAQAKQGQQQGGDEQGSGDGGEPGGDEEIDTSGLFDDDQPQPDQQPDQDQPQQQPGGTPPVGVLPRQQQAAATLAASLSGGSGRGSRRIIIEL